jgi:hypothetical protein
MRLAVFRLVLRFAWWVLALASALALALEAIAYFGPGRSAQLAVAGAILLAALALSIVMGVIQNRMVRRERTATSPAQAERTYHTSGGSHVMVVDGQSVLSAGISELLARYGDLAVESVHPADKDALVAAIRESRPDAVVIDVATVAEDAAELIAQCPDVPCLRVILTSNSGSAVGIYDKSRCQIEDMRDLVALVRGD